MATGNTIYLLDFRRGEVQEIDESVPPEGLSGPVRVEEPSPLQGAGYMLAALGSPPRDHEE